MDVAPLAPFAAAIVGLAGVFFAQHRYTDKLKRDLKKERAAERRLDHAALEETRSRLMADAAEMVETSRAAAHAANDRWERCEKDHQQTREELAAMRGQLEELRTRQAEAERTYTDRETRLGWELEKDRHVKHHALTALAVAEVAMSTVVLLAPRCECGTLEPIRELIDNWDPKYEAIRDENVMSLDRWRQLHADQEVTH